MGNCLSIRSSNRNENNARHSDPLAITAARRNLPLKASKPKWRSDIQLTEGQLKSKRDEFWDTAPAFEGRKEIWDALKAAAHALETDDHTLAQAIVDGANITLPTGTLLDCYDELGSRYQLPIFVLSAPINLIEESNSMEESDPESEHSSEGIDITLKLRLSTSEQDVKFPVKSKDTILKVKRMLEVQQGVPVSQQRWFFSGKLLSDKTRICDAKIPKGFVIQVIISQPDPTPVAS